MTTDTGAGPDTASDRLAAEAAKADAAMGRLQEALRRLDDGDLQPRAPRRRLGRSTHLPRRPDDRREHERPSLRTGRPHPRRAHAAGL